jgi:hypothetical protein
MRQLREVEVRGTALDGESSDIVHAYNHLGCVEGAEPDVRLFVDLPDLGHPIALCPHPHPAVRQALPVSACRFRPAATLAESSADADDLAGEPRLPLLLALLP